MYTRKSNSQGKHDPHRCQFGIILVRDAPNSHSPLYIGRRITVLVDSHSIPIIAFHRLSECLTLTLSFKSRKVRAATVRTCFLLLALYVVLHPS